MTHLANSLYSVAAHFFTTMTSTCSLRFRTLQNHTFLTLAHFSPPQIPKTTIFATAPFRCKLHSHPPAMDPHAPTSEDNVVSTRHDVDNSEQRKVFLEEISRSVSVLTCETTTEGGVCDVYMVGITHLSQVVFLELCSSGMLNVFSQDKEVLTMGEMVDMWKEKHDIWEILDIWYHSKITTLRTWAKMPLWRKIKLRYSPLKAVFFPIPEDLKKTLKKMDDVDVSVMIQEMSKKFATLVETLYMSEIAEYMSSTLMKIASKHCSVVAVVGDGHLPGIKKHWMRPVVTSKLESLFPVSAAGGSYGNSFAETAAAVKILKSLGVAVAGVAIISGIYLAIKK